MDAVIDACATYPQARRGNTLRAIKGDCRQRATAELPAEIGWHIAMSRVRSTSIDRDSEHAS